MTKEQASRLLNELKSNQLLYEKINNASDVQSAIEIARNAGFDVDLEDWINYQKQTGISEEDLESILGGANSENKGCNAAPAA